MKRSKRGRHLYEVKPFPPPKKDPRYFDPEGRLQREILSVVRRTPLWFLDIRWFAKTGKHTLGMNLVFPDPHKPEELLRECRMQRAIHLANGDRELPCSCAWCAWKKIRDSVILPAIEAVASAFAPKERVYIDIDTSRTCRFCTMRRKVEGRDRCSVCEVNHGQR